MQQILKMKQLFIFLLILPSILGGTRCPPRKDIHPCICLDRPIGKKKFETTLICINLQNTNSLVAIEPALMEMEVDKFLLYDSFWTNDLRRSQNQGMPVNSISGYRVNMIEVLDSKLSGLGCPVEMNCRTNFLKRYSAINTTIIDKAACGNNMITIAAWISCPSSIEYFEINQGVFPDGLRPEFFPQPMNKLKVLLLPNNQISRIDKRTFSNSKFPVLHTLDLSYNSLRDLKNIFSSPLKLRHLDLSYNPVRYLLDLAALPQLQSLKLIDSNIVHLLENDWQNAPSSLMHINLSSNKLHCNCGLKWVNSTFHINVDLVGSCAEPQAVVNMKLRRASRLLNQRCDEDGNISPSKLKKKTEQSS